MYLRFGKRFFDTVLSLLGLLFLLPLLLLVAIAVRFSSRGPSLFSQIRTGLHERPFRILKFRTMGIASPGQGSLLTAADDRRVTPLGRWLRKTKVDELPQLWNVLVGHMSLVGPRPEVPLYTDRYSPAQRRVFSARPGITGPSIIFNEEQLIAGRPDKERFYVDVILPAKLEIDIAYCLDVRFASDLRFLALTLGRLFHSPSRVDSTSIQHLVSSSRSLEPISDKR